jgi:hypothetical protein
MLEKVVRVTLIRCRDLRGIRGNRVSVLFRIRAEGSAHYAEIAACCLETVLQDLDHKGHTAWTAEPI